MAMSFEEILKMPTSEFKQPKPFPTGTYHCMDDGRPEHGQSSQKKTDYLRFKYKIIAAGNTVDAREAAEQQVVGKSLQQDFYIIDNDVSKSIIKEFLQNTLGIANPGDAKGIEQMLDDVPNRELLVEVKHEMSQDGKRIFHRVNSTAHV